MTSNAEGLAAAALASMNSPSFQGQEKMADPPKKKNGGNRGRGKQVELKFPVEPRVIQVIKKPRTIMNHSYRDFSCVPPEAGEVVPTDINQMTFPQKVHHILSQPENSKFISWMPHGRAFRISIPKLFESKVCAKYFGHTRYSSFLRQLSNHSFKHLTQGTDRNCYYHEFMLRGLPHLGKYMPRPKDARRLVPDPSNEPDFNAISKAFPLPGGNGNGVNAEPTQEPQAAANMPVAGSPRLASVLVSTSGGNSPMPPAKKPRMEPVVQATPQFPLHVPPVQSPVQAPQVQLPVQVALQLALQAPIPAPAPVQAPAPVSCPQQQVPNVSSQEAQQILHLLVNHAANTSNPPRVVSAPAPPPPPPQPDNSLVLQELAALLRGNQGFTLNQPAAPAPPPPPPQAPQPPCNSALQDLAALLRSSQGVTVNQPVVAAPAPSALQTAQWQAAQERNDAVVAVIRGGLRARLEETPTPPPVSNNSNELATVLAAALVQQFNSNRGGCSNRH
ncbi:shock factor protein HSF8 [Seminavis robusta]|uniref:Shock factor protein HSF8 n=1 Tax=Seminavis robusta TaxID=568900 RepID=A0A9N8DWP9_9STRA|nr:shock factor protein HSF8 [Seminavis robusta]|eukprot:Sro423_g139840.1 shock factor protein HSF8 (503) ;mRNA; r:60680-62272